MEATANNPLASWTGLISNGIDRCIDLRLRDAKWGDQQKKLLDSDLDDLLGVAEQVTRRLGWRRTEPCDGNWSSWLRETVGGLRVKQRELIEAIRGLGVSIATLNYDDLLEEITPLRPLTWQQVERWPPVLDGQDRKPPAITPMLPLTAVAQSLAAPRSI